MKSPKGGHARARAVRWFNLLPLDEERIYQAPCAGSTSYTERLVHLYGTANGTVKKTPLDAVSLSVRGSDRALDWM